MATPILGSSTVDAFIPELWSGRLISNLQKNMVYGGLANKDYEGEISGVGDTVHIQNIGRISVFDYERNGTIPAAEHLADDTRALTITEAKGFNFSVDDIDKAQAKGSLMEEAMKEASYSLADKSDQFIAGLYTDATDGAGLQDALTTNKAKVYDMLVATRQQFRELNVPVNELVTVVAPWIESLLLLDDRFIHATASGDTVLRTGEIGKIAGHTIVVSNNVPVAVNVTDFYQVMTFAGKQGISFAGQINKTEAYRPQDSFSDAVKGLHVYGAKMVRPEFVIVNAVEKA